MKKKELPENITLIRRLKKDGSIDDTYVNSIVNDLIDGKLVLFPVDGIYGIVGIKPYTNMEVAELIPGESVILVSNYLMLDKIAKYDKDQYDFMKRIWPDEINVILYDKTSEDKICLRYPHLKYIQEIIDNVNQPLFFTMFYIEGKSTSKKQRLYKKSDLMKYFSYFDRTVIIDEFCKNRVEPSVVDIAENTLNIIYSGKVSAEEIQSLFFVGKESD